MGWSLGYDSNWDRWIGYGVTAYCDHPECDETIDRGLSYVCGGEPYGGEDGCGLYFCSKHGGGALCERCEKHQEPFTPKPEHSKWIEFILHDKSWQQWRTENPEKVKSFNTHKEMNECQTKQN